MDTTFSLNAVDDSAKLSLSASSSVKASTAPGIGAMVQSPLAQISEEHSPTSPSRRRPSATAQPSSAVQEVSSSIAGAVSDVVPPPKPPRVSAEQRAQAEIDRVKRGEHVKSLETFFRSTAAPPLTGVNKSKSPVVGKAAIPSQEDKLSKLRSSLLLRSEEPPRELEESDGEGEDETPEVIEGNGETIGEANKPSLEDLRKGLLDDLVDEYAVSSSLLYAGTRVPKKVGLTMLMSQFAHQYKQLQSKIDKIGSERNLGLYLTLDRSYKVYFDNLLIWAGFANEVVRRDPSQQKWARESVDAWLESMKIERQFLEELLGESLTSPRELKSSALQKDWEKVQKIHSAAPLLYPEINSKGPITKK